MDKTITEQEKSAIAMISISGIETLQIIRSIRSLTPDSFVLRMIQGIYSGVMRDFTQAALDGDLTLLAKYWLVSAIVGEKDKLGSASQEVRENYNKFKALVEEILENGIETEIVWKDFDKI